ncbi:hypothetical protein J8J40_22250, partial [Mycobacterium tuberculosis]|nr:hypothetical protein [Mycobacterium tuberculosis]
MAQVLAAVKAAGGDAVTPPTGDAGAAAGQAPTIDQATLAALIAAADGEAGTTATDPADEMQALTDLLARLGIAVTGDDSTTADGTVVD